MSEKQENYNYQNPYQGYPYYYYPPTSPAYYPTYQYRQFPPNQPQQQIQQSQQLESMEVPGMLPMEQSYIENILRLNKGKNVQVYMTFENNAEWNAKIFKGVIEAAGRDHLILSQPETGKRVLLLMIYLDYIIFDEEINYQNLFQGYNQLSTYQPR